MRKRGTSVDPMATDRSLWRRARRLAAEWQKTQMFSELLSQGISFSDESSSHLLN
jgi:hypothetical protein